MDNSRFVQFCLPKFLSSLDRRASRDLMRIRVTHATLFLHHHNPFYGGDIRYDEMGGGGRRRGAISHLRGKTIHSSFALLQKTKTLRKKVVLEICGDRVLENVGLSH